MRRFVIYLDILGFGIPIEDIAQQLHLTPQDVKQNWLGKINTSLQKCKEDNFITDFCYRDSDNWLILSKAADDVYQLLKIISDVGLPLEIAIDFRRLPESSPFLSDEMMSFLSPQNNILKDYRNWFKQKNQNSIKESFIVVTEQAFLVLGSDSYWGKPYPNANYYHYLSKNNISSVSTLNYTIAGRRQEIKLFEALCADRINHYGLWFYGPGGIGKSALIRQCCQISKSVGYKIIGDKDKIIKENPALFFIRVCGFEKEKYQVSESTTIKSEIITKLINELHKNTIVVIDASKDFEDYNGLIDFAESFIERLKSLENRVFLLIATRMAPPYNPFHIYRIGLTGFRNEAEIKDFLELKGMEDLKQYAKVLLEKTGGWPLVLETICSSP
jgi:hypothetical protein